jgi:nucleolar protein 9
MGQKRNRQEDEEAPAHVEEAAAADTEAAPNGDNGDDEGAPRGRRSRSLVNPETASYLEDVVSHFKTLVDDEERGLLVGNVLEEISGKEVKVAGDPVCSRHVEILMAAAQAQHLLKFLTSVSDVDGFFMLVSRYADRN